MNTPVPYHQKIISITVSMGIASLENDVSYDIETLFSHADEALYQSKKEGRNRVTIWKCN
jgi:diguanylate cyclase (GGDEF)-like protein